MCSMAKTRYKKKNITKDWLLSSNFRYNRLLSNNEEEVYTYRFPVYKYNKFVTLECELQVIFGEDEIKVNLYDYGTNNKYAAFYYSEYGNYSKFMKGIYDKINQKLNNLGIERIETKWIHIHMQCVFLCVYLWQ